MTLGICDDNEMARNAIHEICEKTMQKYQIECKIIEFIQGKDIFQYKDEINILILDIEMPELSGIDIKTRLQYKNKKTFIIFVTNHDEMMVDAFGTNVIAFVVKDSIKEQLAKALTSAVMLAERFVLVDGNIDSRDIVYIKSENIYCILIMSDGRDILIRQSSKELERQLVKVNFVRVHRSYIINMQWLDQIKKQKVQVKGNDVPMSVRLKVSVKNAYQEFCRENARYC